MLDERKLWELISQYRTRTHDSRLNGNFLTAENIISSLDLFKNIVEFMGVYKEIMNEIKCDLTEAIFSHKLTANEKENMETVERIPFFLLYNNALEIQKLNSEEFDKKSDKLTQEIVMQCNKLKELSEINEKKDNKLKIFESDMKTLQNDINDLELKIQTINDKKLENENNMHNIIDQMKKDNTSLKEELNRKTVLNGEMKIYKDAHEHLDSSFMDACQDYSNEDENRQVNPFYKKANLEMEIKTIVSMDDDLLILENLMLTDFDKRIMEFKKNIMEYKYIEDDSNDIPYLENIDTDKLIVQIIMNFNKAKLHFQNEFAQLQIESLMLQNHQSVLINDWSIIHESEMENETNLFKGHKEFKASFVIEDRIMSKYSAIIYISNDGKNYYECKDVRFCESCGNKSVFCPHDINQKEKIIKLPSGSAFIKIQRPNIAINSKYAKYFISKSNKLTEENPEIVSTEERKESSRKSLRSSLLSSVSNSDSETMIPFDSLLEDFENRTKIKRIYPRNFNEFQILSIIEDFWATTLNEDDYDSQLSDVTTLLDKLYLFFLDRYSHEKAAMLSLYDFLMSVVENSENSQIIQLFCHVLISNIDSSVMRYLFHLVDCIELVNWKNEEDFRYFLSVIHPFLNEDDIDSVVLSYISFSENVFEQSIIFEFLIYNFIKHRDPRFAWVKTEANDLKTTIPGFYTFKEFQVLLESMTSLPNKKLSIRLFKELAFFYTDEGSIEIAPFSKISEIIAFLSLLESVENIKQKLYEKYGVISETKKKPIRWSFSRLTILASKLLREN